MSRFSIATDCVIFLKEGQQVNLLLIKRRNDPFKDKWALPGGMLEENETLEQCAARELGEETCLTLSELHQVAAFSAPDRDPRGRIISMAFYGVADPANRHVQAASDASDTAWHPMNALPELAFDHREIIDRAFTVATNHSDI